MAESEDAETKAAAESARQGEPAADVRRWLLEATSGTLCTLSSRAGIEGYPFGSVVPFALDSTGRPHVLIAGIAAHTRNLRADARGSLFVPQPDSAGDPQSGWRVTLTGRWRRVICGGSDPDIGLDETPYADLEARYRERVPGAADYLKTHDFDFWRLETEAVRYIAGFGRICWVEPPEIFRDPLGAGLKEAAAGAIAHMNEDHRDALRDLCTGLAGFTPEAARMVDLDRAGMTLQEEGAGDAEGGARRVYLSFGREIEASQIRGAVVDLVKRARQAG